MRRNIDGNQTLTARTKDGGPSRVRHMTFKAEILLIGAAIVASLVLAHMLEGARLAAVIQ